MARRLMADDVIRPNACTRMCAFLFLFVRVKHLGLINRKSLDVIRCEVTYERDEEVKSNPKEVKRKL